MKTRILFFMLTLLQTSLFAQDSTSRSTATSTTTTTTTTWYLQPWVWVVGGAVLLIIIVSLLRGNSRKEVNRTTVIRDNRP